MVFTIIMGSFHDLRRNMHDEEKPNGSTKLTIGDVMHNDIVATLKDMFLLISDLIVDK